MSETSPVVMTDPPNNKRYGSIGQPIPATTTKVPVTYTGIKLSGWWSYTNKKLAGAAL